MADLTYRRSEGRVPLVDGEHINGTIARIKIENNVENDHITFF
jgi:hypothetical protein